MKDTFVGILTPKIKSNSIEDYMSKLSDKEKNALHEHFAYMEMLDKSGVIVIGGPCLNASKLIIIFQAESLSEANNIILDDPTVKVSMVDYEIHPFQIAVGRIK